MKKRSRIIIIIIIILICIGCAILSGTPYFKNKMAKLTQTQKEHFEDGISGTACLGGLTGSYLQGPGGVKDCYTLEGKLNSVPENFFKKPIFFDNTSLHLQNNLDSNEQLQTSIKNRENKLYLSLNKSESNFDIVRSPLLPSQPYTPSYTPPQERSETTTTTTTSTQNFDIDVNQFNLVEKKVQKCDGSIQSTIGTIVDTVKKTIGIDTSETSSTTRQIEDTPSQVWRPPQPFQLPKNVGHDEFPADESKDQLLHRLSQDGAARSTGTIRTMGGVHF